MVTEPETEPETKPETVLVNKLNCRIPRDAGIVTFLAKLYKVKFSWQDFFGAFTYINKKNIYTNTRINTRFQTMTEATEKHHAEYSHFSAGSKEDGYQVLLESAQALFADEDGSPLPAVSNLSNASALLWSLFQEITPSVNWAGFYIRSPLRSSSSSASQPKPPGTESLILGPFQGKVACQVIRFGKGVCGTAASTKETQLVRNVHEFPGHIACDGDSNSEIVVPLVHSNGTVLGVIDIDSTELGSFDQVDQKYLEQLAKLVVEGTDWEHYL